MLNYINLLIDEACRGKQKGTIGLGTNMFSWTDSVRRGRSVMTCSGWSSRLVKPAVQIASVDQPLPDALQDKTRVKLTVKRRYNRYTHVSGRTVLYLQVTVRCWELLIIICR